MKDFRRLDSAELYGKTALVRVDFNVPRTDDGGVADDTRIRTALPTIAALREAGAQVVLLSHMGRPRGAPDPELSLRFLVPHLQAATGESVGFGPDSKAGIVLLENTRFSNGETANAPELAREWAKLGDLFVLDAFSSAHRAHASTVGLAEVLPAYAGLALERELDHLSQALDNPQRPVMAIVGGAKVSTKIGVLEHLVTRLDALVIGGGMANTFLNALGHPVGRSLHEPSQSDTALGILEAARESGCEVVLPLDAVVAEVLEPGADSEVRALEDVRPDEMILDAGPATVERVLDRMDAARTLVWNGPLGAFETPPFDTSTVECARYAARRTRESGLVSIAGGGDTVAALEQAGVAEDFTFVSTAGGAFLEWMEGKALPGIDALRTET